MNWIFLLGLSFLFQPQQNLEGTWQGTLTHEGGYAASYGIMIHLSQKGDTFSGRSVVKVEDITATMEIEGKYLGKDLLVLKDIKIVDQSIKGGMEWCLKEYQLRLEQDKEGKLTLSGTWQGSTSFGLCIPGTLKLERPKERA
ncbi:MAG: hypothetical protein HKN16_11120 [Saprospiraceae bacterium]|nr:hypothetical protein [Saprospiraceae bacterium]